MNASFRISLAVLLALLLAVAGVAARAQDITPLRLSYVEGDVSFWRFGADDWVEARRNIALAAGDELYVDARGIVELQMGNRAFVRADEDTQLGLLNQTGDFLQFRVARGRVSFDLRTLPAGFVIEVNTPNAVFTIDRSGYYRLDVDEEVHFVTRRGGRAVMVAAGGEPLVIQPSEEVVVRGTSPARAETFVAPEPDRWDRWNYERSDSLLDAFSERYLPPGVAGAWELDYYGRWRVVPDYGPVWVPDAVPSGWVPYSAGRWIWDPYYEWTWIDDAPWGWAPFHYGRWVFVGGFWAWAPGPLVSVAVYAPALVAFYDLAPSFSISIGFGTPGLAWVSLGWGEPLLPWWGRPGFVGRPWWGGWGGPRIVNNVVVKSTTVINVNQIVYVNSRVGDAVVATERERFAAGAWHREQRRLTHTAQARLQPVRGVLPVKPRPASLIADAPRAKQPPEALMKRPVVVKSAPPAPKLPWRAEVTPRPAVRVAPERRLVTVPGQPARQPVRPEFGAGTGGERERPPPPPRLEDRSRAQPQPAEPRGTDRERQRAPAAPPPPAVRERADTPQPESRAPRPMPSAPVQPRTVEPREERRPVPEPKPAAAPQGAPQAAPGRQQERAELPGKPANRVYRGSGRERDETEPGRQHDRR